MWLASVQSRMSTVWLLWCGTLSVSQDACLGTRPPARLWSGEKVAQRPNPCGGCLNVGREDRFGLAAYFASTVVSHSRWLSVCHGNWMRNPLRETGRRGVWAPVVRVAAPTESDADNNHANMAERVT